MPSQGEEPATPDERSSRSHATVACRDCGDTRCDVGAFEAAADVELLEVGALREVEVVAAREALRDDVADDGAATPEPVMSLDRNLTSFVTGSERVDWATPAPAPAIAERRVGCRA